TGRSITNAGALSLANGGLQDLALKDFGAATNFVVDVLGYYEPPATNPDPTADLDTMGSHACRVAVFGTVECWGNNNFGQLGNGTELSRQSPLKISGLRDVTSVTGGRNDYTCALISGGSAKCWGRNTEGTLGDGTAPTDQVRPVTVSGLTSAVALAGGDEHVCALLQDRTVSCWGYGGDGRLGDGTTTDRITPFAVPGLTNVAAVSAGSNFTCALLTSGGVRCWGDNFNGQLGLGSTTDQLSPVTLSSISGATSIATGSTHACAGLADGTVRCWGRNSAGQLGDGTVVNRSTPGPVPGLSAVVAVDAGNLHTCALLADGTAKCWGENVVGQGGDGTGVNRSTPATVTGLTGTAGLRVGTSSTCAIATNGTARCWGFNGSGELGDGTSTNRLAPVGVSGLSGTAAVDVDAGDSHNCVVIYGGTARCWGYNNNGQLGDGTQTDSAAPVDVLGDAGGILRGVVAIATGGFHTCALIFDGTARCWGAGSLGQLGNSSTTDKTVPATVTGLVGAVSLALGKFHSCALLADGTAKCWGNGVNFELGNGSNAGAESTPVTVTGLAGATALSAGFAHTCAVLANRTIRCWGNNAGGQLGDGTTSARPSPTEVTGLTGALGVSAGVLHTCAPLADGTSKCWGDNTYGQLGNGNTTGQLSPVNVSGLSSALTISTNGDRHACALQSSEAIKCWGDNDFGKLGDGTTTDRLTPVSLFIGLDPAGTRSIAAGGSHTCALAPSGTVRCWGFNLYGQVGDGTTTDRSSPTLVTGIS
ncbi:MAG: RCC1 repeat-containing protein, partial [Actinomycetes bacterium]